MWTSTKLSGTKPTFPPCRVLRLRIRNQCKPYHQASCQVYQCKRCELTLSLECHRPQGVSQVAHRLSCEAAEGREERLETFALEPWLLNQLVNVLFNYKNAVLHHAGRRKSQTASRPLLGFWSWRQAQGCLYHLAAPCSLYQPHAQLERCCNGSIYTCNSSCQAIAGLACQRARSLPLSLVSPFQRPLC